MPKIIGASLTEHRLRTRGRLFSALAELMAERGLDAITMADIAARAQVGRTAVYNHFSDKEALLLAYISDQVERYAAQLESAVADAGPDPVDQLRCYIRHQAQLKHLYHLPGSDVRVVVSAPTLTRLREHAIAIEVLLRRILAAGIETGQLPAQDVDAIVPMINACLTGRALPATEPERSQALAATELFVLRAVGAN